MDMLRKTLNSSGSKLYDKLVSRFVPVPSSVCECGKPVVFRQPSMKFTCTRCDRVYELVVQVRRVE